jgi:hypothetical protein
MPPLLQPDRAARAADLVLGHPLAQELLVHLALQAVVTAEVVTARQAVRT